jgi:Pvc16 N-terminal domain
VSNALAIAAVTTTLRQLIIRGVTELPNDNVTTMPLDKAFNGNGKDQINLFLYQTVPNAVWRNRDLPNQVKPGETGQPPLALNLHYLISATGDQDNEIRSQEWLGKAMSILHDHPVLGKREIQDAVQAVLSGSDLHEQIDRLRITPLLLTLDDLSKLWGTFSSPYRLSAAYEVSVVLIDSTRPPKTPLPVLSRGFGDRGATVQPSLVSPFPTLEALILPKAQPSIQFGDTAMGEADFTLKGHHLEGDDRRVLLQHSRLPNPLVAEILAGTAESLLVKLPPIGNLGSSWLAGFYTVRAAFNQPPHDRTTNELPLSLAPKIDPGTPIGIERRTRRSGETYGDLIIALRCIPAVTPDQRVSLLLGDRELTWIKPELVTSEQRIENLQFRGREIPPDQYFVRLRVDGVDSLLIDYTQQPPIFNPQQKVVLS